jgi:hypothetical protein
VDSETRLNKRFLSKAECKSRLVQEGAMRSRIVVVSAFLLLVGITLGTPGVAWSVPAETTRVSVSSTGEEADAESLACAPSASGRFVAFLSGASNLVADDSKRPWDFDGGCGRLRGYGLERDHRARRGFDVSLGLLP